MCNAPAIPVQCTAHRVIDIICALRACVNARQRYKLRHECVLMGNPE